MPGHRRTIGSRSLTLGLIWCWHAHFHRPRLAPHVSGERPVTKVAWIGLGAMGARMARRLMDAGYHVTVWNRTPGRADALTAAGAHAAATSADAVRDADVVFLMLSDPAAVSEVID